MDIKLIRKELKEWLLKNIAGKKVYNASIDKYIVINRSGLKHALSFSHKNYVQKLKSLYSIEDIVKNARYVRTEVDNRNRKQIKEIIILEYQIIIEELNYYVKVVVRHTNEGRFYYDHALIDIQKKK